ncbi:tyrosine-type recombinase/integrase [Bacillus pseudomycoides]|uniref:tyrosine-type recombinase/integrase n=1 Tax=Bacillus pseudomycoides TaxID=64104 RepID=UPI0001A14D96|nr:tyrosine-type recombinase/integrase [Bacillus pseudomycoides]EEM07731.1 Integrase/recombinase [Bacillus pseudomycoides]KFN09863.1 phage integrase family protein [Bacillus pseudomycoides]MDR4189264.1 tyrosine-type recombinase/integrase [Bacillus pseudomycoides]MED0857991.1 tyrosine-type recombinase/integrase [Bacillus pseudomycoides]
MLHKYRKYLIDKGKSQNTVLSYINDLQIFFQEMRLNPDSYVISNDIKKWTRNMLNPREGKTLSVSTINRRLNTLRSYFSWAEREQYIKVNPMRDIKDLKVADEEYEKIMWLTEKEFEALLDRMRKYPVKTRGVNPEEKYRRDRAIIYILTYAGLRVEELSSLKITDIDIDFKKIRVIGKGTKVRTVPMSNFLYNEVLDWLQFRNKIAKDKEIVNQSPYVFYSQRSEKFSIRGIQAMIENYSTSDKKLTPHMFRHTFCKWMLKATNNDIEKVRRLAGHSHISTTTRYLKNSFDELTDAVEAMPIF